MEELAIYLVKSALCTSVFFGIYRCFLRNETFYQFNRYFLLGGIICSLILPFYQYQYTVNLPVVTQVAPFSKSVLKADLDAIPFWAYTGLFLYTGVASIFILRHITGLIKIKKLVTKYGYSILQGYKIINTSALNTSFSVFNYVFLSVSSDTSETEKKLIMEHELAHIKQYHWADLLLVQMMCVMQWFNPFAWLYVHAMKENHEFLADEAVLKKGNSPAVYRAALINHSLKTTVFTFASSFADYDRFKRISMMMKPTSNPARKMVVLLVIPFAALFIMAFAKPSYRIVSNQKINHPQPNLKATEEHALLTNIPVAGKKKPTHTVLASQTNKITRRQVPAIQSPPNQNPADQFSADQKNKKEQITVTVNAKGLTLESSDPQSSLKTNPPLILLDGNEVASLDHIKPEMIASVSVFKGDQAIETYGQKGKYGVMVITSKAAIQPTEK